VLALALETANEKVSVAVGAEQKVLSSVVLEDKRSAGKLLVPTIKDLLEKNNLSISQIDCIFLDLGPGSYTGIRIGGIIAKTIAFFLNKKYYGVSSLEVMAYRYMRSMAVKSTDYIIALSDARASFVCYAIFSPDKTILKEVGEIKVASIDNFIAQSRTYPNSLFITFDETIFNTLRKYTLQIKLVEFPSAKDVLEIGFYKLKNGYFFLSEPFYPRRSYAEEKFNLNVSI
jgi:tRNA threonylcarbamoyladenosine biosynthesis protein TsaB